MATIEQLLNKVSTGNGHIVSTAGLSEAEIAEARASDNLYVNDDGLGFAYVRYYEHIKGKDPKWV